MLPSYITSLYYQDILLVYITKLYYQFILPSYITSLYYQVILLVYITKGQLGHRVLLDQLDLFKMPSEALTVIEIYTKTTTHLPIIDLAPGDIWTTPKEFGVQLGEIPFHRLIPNNSFICLICKTVPN
ncbi:hypothetical protein EB796_009404 [Bugula neritina]|uniref:Fibrillar collagen NC1 domain-containing protein n=1 Tax=Bugula neritina TaxID=10212 RepID=A0A7J7K296_BUGNE|nr:hypothetical protein EB796_009404 [Bugula neritina]